MLNLYPLPIDAVAWCIGAAVLWIFVLKSILNYRISQNPLVPMYVAIGVSLGLACLFFGLPVLLTHNTRILFYTNYVGDIFVQICMLAEAWLVWFIGWRRYVTLRAVLIPTAIVSLVILVIEFHTSRITFSESPYLLIYNDSSIVLWLKSLLYVTIAWPIGYYFIRQGLKQAAKRAMTKLVATGLTFMLISGAAVYSNLLNHGSDTFSGAVQNFIVFSVFLVIVIWPRRPKKLQKSFQPQP